MWILWFYACQIIRICEHFARFEWITHKDICAYNVAKIELAQIVSLCAKFSRHKSTDNEIKNVHAQFGFSWMCFCSDSIALHGWNGYFVARTYISLSVLHKFSCRCQNKSTLKLHIEMFQFCTEFEMNEFSFRIGAFSSLAVFSWKIIDFINPNKLLSICMFIDKNNKVNQINLFALQSI